MTLLQTMKIQIYPTKRQAQVFANPNGVCECLPICSTYMFSHRQYALRKVNDAAYATLRQTFGLPAQLAQSACRLVVARYQTAQTQMRQNPVRYRDRYTGAWHSYTRTLDHLQKPLQFKKRVLRLVRNRNYSYRNQSRAFSLGTLHGRERVSFCWDEATSYFAKYQDPKWSFGEAELLERAGKWYLHIAAQCSAPSFEKETTRQIVGIDRGLRHLVTTYDSSGNTAFFDGRAILHTREKFQRLRQELQAKNTKASKRRLRAIGQRENRWMRDVNHTLSKALVAAYGKDTVFVLEDLTGVTFRTVKGRKKARRYEHHSWAFYELEQFLAYKAKAAGAIVLSVSPRYTSQRCPQCGTIDKDHRDLSNRHYHCLVCDYQSNDDRVAAMNLHTLGRRWVAGETAPAFTKTSSSRV